MLDSWMGRGQKGSDGHDKVGLGSIRRPVIGLGPTANWPPKVWPAKADIDQVMKRAKELGLDEKKKF